MMMSYQNFVQWACPYKEPANLNQVIKQVAGSKFQDSRPQDRSVTEQKDIPSRSQVIGTRKEATSEAMDHLKKKSIKLILKQEGTVFVFNAPLLEGESEVQGPTL